MSINLIKSTIYLRFCAQWKPFLFSTRPANGAEEPNLDEWPTAVYIERVHFLLQ